MKNFAMSLNLNSEQKELLLTTHLSTTLIYDKGDEEVQKAMSLAFAPKAVLNMMPYVSFDLISALDSAIRKHLVHIFFNYTLPSSSMIGLDKFAEDANKYAFKSFEHVFSRPLAESEVRMIALIDQVLAYHEALDAALSIDAEESALAIIQVKLDKAIIEMRVFDFMIRNYVGFKFSGKPDLMNYVLCNDNIAMMNMQPLFTQFAELCPKDHKSMVRSSKLFDESYGKTTSKGA